MAFTGVPMFIGGGSARHAASVVRTANHIATQGQQGVLGALDLRVLELATPGGAVRLSPGGLALLNTASGGDYETYVDKSGADIELPINPTGTAGGRNDLVIVRVEDPYVSGTGGPAGGWPTPTDPAVGPYIFGRVIENVGTNPDGTAITDVSQAPTYANWTATTHARLEIPASTGTITQGMITDLRSIADLSGQRVDDGTQATSLYTQVKTSTGTWTGTAPGPDPLLSTDTAFIDWPAAANFTLPIPQWATHFDFEIKVANIHKHSGPFWGEWRWFRTDTAGVSAAFPIDLNQNPAQGGTRDVIWMGGESFVDPAIRGSTVGFKMQARSLDSALTGTLSADRGTFSFLTFVFKRKPVYS
jgi:hypothetical protein